MTLAGYLKHATLLATCVALSACVYGPSDSQVEKDFQEASKLEGGARIIDIARGDGWSEGAELRVRFCQPISPASDCREGNASMSYQKQPNGSWRLVSISQEHATEH